MRALLAVLFILPFTAFSQDCSIRKEVDQFTQKPKLTTGFTRISNGTVSYSIDANNTEIDFFFLIKPGGEAKCYDDGSTAVASFDNNKSKMNLKNASSMNCDGMFHFTFKNTPNTQYGLTRLSTFKVASIKITGTDGKPMDIVFTDAEKEQFMKLAACMAEQAKTLNAPPAR